MSLHGPLPTGQSPLVVSRIKGQCMFDLLCRCPSHSLVLVRRKIVKSSGSSTAHDPLFSIYLAVHFFEELTLLDCLYISPPITLPTKSRSPILVILLLILKVHLGPYL